MELSNNTKDTGELKNLAVANLNILKELKAEWEKYAKKYELTLPSEKVAYGTDEIWRD